jgi:hypothetical protein
MFGGTSPAERISDELIEFAKMCGSLNLFGAFTKDVKT